MKNYYIIIVLIISILNACRKPATEKNLLGTWRLKEATYTEIQKRRLSDILGPVLDSIEERKINITFTDSTYTKEITVNVLTFNNSISSSTTYNENKIIRFWEITLMEYHKYCINYFFINTYSFDENGEFIIEQGERCDAEWHFDGRNFLLKRKIDFLSPFPNYNGVLEHFTEDKMVIKGRIREGKDNIDYLLNNEYNKIDYEITYERID